MKKYALCLIILVFALGLFTLNTKPASAYDWGCISGNLYSTTTGAYCGGAQTNNYFNSSYDFGCTSNGPYNTINGAPCYGISGAGTSVYPGNLYNNRQFQIGERGDEVRNLQQTLRDASFYSGRIDGVYGTRTHEAFLNYQNQYSYQNPYIYPNYPYQIPSVPVIGGYNYNAPTIYSITPSRGRVGTEVTIYGTGFGGNGCTAYACTNLYQTSVNKINFGGSTIDAYSSNGQSLTFVVPSYLTPFCPYSTYGCFSNQTKVSSGVYPVSVINSYGTSNVINFTVTTKR